MVGCCQKAHLSPPPSWRSQMGRGLGCHLHGHRMTESHLEGTGTHPSDAVLKGITQQPMSITPIRPEPRLAFHLAFVLVTPQPVHCMPGVANAQIFFATASKTLSIQGKKFPDPRPPPWLNVCPTVVSECPSCSAPGTRSPERSSGPPGIRGDVAAAGG